MNVHTDPNKLYSPFTVASSGRVTVLPVYYGMLQFHRYASVAHVILWKLVTQTLAGNWNLITDGHHLPIAAQVV